ncbi:MAG: ATP-binding protein [Alphaproteobacteria bacterium]|nr:ATP-binding protein [Alphaproteobacteria bacterium]
MYKRQMQRNIRDGVGTITRQVGEIRRLVDEFSSFARMPEPKRQATDLAEIMEEVREILAAEAESPARAAAVSVTRGDEFFSAPWIGDSGQLRRALHNLARNALLAIDERRAADADAPAGEVALRMRQDDRNYYLVIEDNGAGLPAIPAMELLQPYVTTRRDGSGLGLAVVQKIAEDHGGALSLRGREDRRGAVAVLRLPKTPVAVAGET